VKLLLAPEPEIEIRALAEIQIKTEHGGAAGDEMAPVPSGKIPPATA
jgi:hypothetical protein